MAQDLKKHYGMLMIEMWVWEEEYQALLEEEARQAASAPPEMTPEPERPPRPLPPQRIRRKRGRWRR